MYTKLKFLHSDEMSAVYADEYPNAVKDAGSNIRHQFSRGMLTSVT